MFRSNYNISVFILTTESMCKIKWLTYSKVDDIMVHLFFIVCSFMEYSIVFKRFKIIIEP